MGKSSSIRLLLFALVLTCAVVGVAACYAPGSGTYCQSGPKYGTSCYAPMDVTQAPGAPPAPVRIMEPRAPSNLSQPPPWMPNLQYVPGASAPGSPTPSAAPPTIVAPSVSAFPVPSSPP
ncbi:MAG: hypothetical protein HY898_32640 [Deltaproteobacteria bacterium]|nr:hypothetical protein [Deltaproteobacteria bacterium]